MVATPNPRASMTLITSMLERPLDPGYAAAAERRALAGDGTRRRRPRFADGAWLLFGVAAVSVVFGASAWLLAMGAAIGFYDGLFGPGTGSFLIFLFIRFFGLDFLRASAASKIVNIATNLAALSFFVPSGHVLLAFAVPMAVANVGGAFAGTRLALRGGTPVIRKLFVLLVVVLIAKMAWDTAAG